MLAAAMALSFSACQNEEPLDAPVAKDALALMPAETPVSIQAQLQGGFAQGGSRTGTTTNWYASDEIHPTKQNMRFTLLMPGGSSETVLTNQLSSFDQLPQTEPFSTLMLKDFNLTEGNNRCVSRWTSLYVTSNGSDWLFGFARLKANASGQPVLDYGKLGRAYAKVTLVLQDELQQPIAVNQHGILAKLTQAKSSVGPMYTPEGETQGMAFSNIKNGIQTLVSDEEIAKENLGWAVLKNDGMWEHSLSGMCNADGTEYYFGANDNELTAIVFPTPTHVSEDRIYTPIQGGPQLTDDEVLTIEVNTDPDGANGPLTTGKYTLKLKDVKVVENGQQKPLTALESGKHLTLTVTLQHNMLVQATATIGDWDQVSADVDLNDDAAKILPYEYKEADNTYYIYMKEGIEPALADREANHSEAAIISNVPGYAIAYDATSLYAWAAAVRTAMNAGAETHPNLILADNITLPAKTEEGQGTDITVTEGVPSGSNWTPVREYDAEGYIIAYKGTIDGRGHIISGLRINSTAGETAFISNLDVHSMVKNLTFDDAVVYSTQGYTAVIAAYSFSDWMGDNDAMVENCHVTSNSSVKSTDKRVGGIVGENGGLMMGCTNAAAVETTYTSLSNNVGGIVGCNTMGTIIACANTGSVTNPNDNDNVAGKTYACWSTAAEDLQNNYGGGQYGERTACYIIAENLINPVDDWDGSEAVSTIAEAVEKMNSAIAAYNVTAPQNKKCPYTWELPQGESTPKLKKSNL